MKKHEEELSEIMLEKARSSFEHFNNPYYASYAIDVCIKNKKALPSWRYTTPHRPAIYLRSASSLSSMLRQRRHAAALAGCAGSTQHCAY
jgi:hypothetical protein